MNIKRVFYKCIRLRKKEGINMEMRKEQNVYTVVDREKALQSILNCSKKYEKTLKALSK